MSWSQIDSTENCQIAASPPSQGGENNNGVSFGSHSTDGVDRATNKNNGRQNYGGCCSGSGSFFSDSPIAGRAVYRYKYAGPEGVSAGMLCKQGMLRHLARAHGTSKSTASEIGF